MTVPGTSQPKSMAPQQGPGQPCASTNTVYSLDSTSWHVRTTYAGCNSQSL